MPRSTFYFLCALCALLFLSPRLAQAQAPFDPAARAATVAPFLDDETIAIGHVDLERLDGAAIVKLLSHVAPPGDPEVGNKLAQLEQSIKAVKTAFRAGGIGEIFAVVSLRDIPKEPVFLVAPLKTGADPAAAAAVLKEMTRLPAAEAIGPAVVAASPEVLARLKGQRPTARPDLAKAFTLAGDTTAQFILAPTDDTRRVIREMLPRLPKEVGGGSGEVLADGLRWAVLSVNAPPKLSLNLTVQAKDEAAAAALGAMATNAIQTLRQREADHEAKLDRQGREGVEAAVRLFTPQVKGDQLVIAHVQEDKDVQALLKALVPAVQAARIASGRMTSANNVRHLVIAMHNYHESFSRFPPQAIRSKDGKALLSWRVALLPFLDQRVLYDEFHLDEPWNSEHNKKLIEKMPEVLASPHLGSALKDKGMTNYLAPLSKQPAAVAVVPPDDPKKPIVNGKNEMVFDLPQGTLIARILDGTSNTILIVETHPSDAVVWTKPDDLVIDAAAPLKALLGQPNDGFSAAFADGSVRFITSKIDPKNLLNLLQMNDGNPVEVP